jgi:hypothetical protein
MPDKPRVKETRPEIIQGWINNNLQFIDITTNDDDEELALFTILILTYLTSRAGIDYPNEKARQEFHNDLADLCNKWTSKLTL